MPPASPRHAHRSRRSFWVRLPERLAVSGPRCAVGVAVVAALLATGVPGHAGPLPVRRYGVSEGLVDSVVRAIHQDAKGYLWFATANGVSRFDGYRFVNYTIRDGLGHPFINTVVGDPAGGILGRHEWRRYCPIRR